MSLQIKSLPGLILCFTLIAMPLAAAAQAPGEAHIHIHETPEPQQVTTTTGAVGLSLMTVFSLLDPNNQLMTSFEIQDATITVDNDKYKAEVQELETPWTVVVLADTSKNLGSFSSAAEFKFARTSLATAITGLPDNTQMALMTFASTPSTAEEFTQKKETISTAISRLRASGSGNSCLNNGLYQAVNKLSGATGRKAVIVFTASSDDCAERTPQEVVNLAQQNGVQIYGVGLKGYTITLDELKALTEPTGGLAEIRDQTGLVFGLNNIIGIFRESMDRQGDHLPIRRKQNGHTDRQSEGRYLAQIERIHFQFDARLHPASGNPPQGQGAIHRRRDCLQPRSGAARKDPPTECDYRQQGHRAIRPLPVPNQFFGREQVAGRQPVPGPGVHAERGGG